MAECCTECFFCIARRRAARGGSGGNLCRRAAREHARKLDIFFLKQKAAARAAAVGNDELRSTAEASTPVLTGTKFVGLNTKLILVPSGTR